MHIKTIIFSDKSLTFRCGYCNFSERYMMTSPLRFYLSLNAFSPTFWISCQPLWAPSQCFFGAQMTELGSTFKDNCLIGVFSYAVGSWGPEKGSDNSVIMRLQQIYAFAAELWRMSWQPRALSTSTLPPWTLRYSQNCGASFNTNTRVFARVSVWVCVCIVRTHDCISVYEWDVRVCLNPARLQVCLGKKIFASAFIPAALPLSPIWKVEEHYYMVHLLPSGTALGYKVSDEVYLCKLFLGGNITYMAAAFTWAFFFPKAWLSI